VRGRKGLALGKLQPGRVASPVGLLRCVGSNFLIRFFSFSPSPGFMWALRIECRQYGLDDTLMTDGFDV
jgi:hypothetical protein